MKVAFILTRSDALGGATIHVRDMCLRLIKDGFDAKVFIGGSGMAADELKSKGVPLHSLQYLQRSVDPMADVRAILELRRELRVFKPNIVSTHTSKAGFVGRIAGRLLGIPTLYTPHCWAFCDGFPNARLYRWVERFGSYWGPKVITVSEWERQLALKNKVVSNKKLITLYNGMPEISNDLQANPVMSPPKIVMIGRFEPQKNHRLLLEALFELRGLDWSLELIGHGPQQLEMEAFSDELGIRERINFAGYRSDIAQRLATAQIYTLISNWESFPRSILEAMRAGLPIITTDVGGCPESVSDKENGFVIPAGDVGQLTKRLRVLIEDKDLRLKMGRESRELYKTRFTFDQMYQATSRVYREFLAKSVNRP